MKTRPEPWRDPHYLRKLYKEWDYGAPPHYMVKLPCGHGSIELEEPRDILVSCPECGKKAEILWSLAKQEIRWEQER